MLSPVSTTPLINCSPVSTTPPVSSSDKLMIDDRGPCFLHNYLRPPKSTTVTNIVIGTAMKRLPRPLTRPDQRPLRPIKLLQTKITLFSFGALRGLLSRCVGCLCMQLFMAVPMTPSAAMANFGGGRYRRFIPFKFLLSLAAPHLHSVLVIVTGHTNLLLVSLSPPIIVHSCRCHP
jgi:hypothetical protein